MSHGEETVHQQPLEVTARPLRLQTMLEAQILQTEP